MCQTKFLKVNQSDFLYVGYNTFLIQAVFLKTFVWPTFQIQQLLSI